MKQPYKNSLKSMLQGVNDLIPYHYSYQLDPQKVVFMYSPTEYLYYLLSLKVRDIENLGGQIVKKSVTIHTDGDRKVLGGSIEILANICTTSGLALLPINPN